MKQLTPWLAVAVHPPAPHRQGMASEPSSGASAVRGCEHASRNPGGNDVHMGVSKNNGTPKSSILIGFSKF